MSSAIGFTFNAQKNHKKGTSIVEFAFIAPVVLLMLVGLIHLSQLIQARHKITTLGGLLGGSLTGQAFSAQKISNLCLASLHSLPPLKSNLTQVTVSCIYMPSSTPLVAWQFNIPGSGIPAQSSKIGTSGSGASLSALPNFSLQPGQSALCVEVFYKLTPLVESPYFGPLQQKILYHISVHLPVAGRMTTLLP